jgi:hypothetical protein
LGAPTLEQLLARAEVWANRWSEVRAQAQLLACGDRKLRWDLGPREEHCVSCSFLNGRVYRASTWEANGVYPQARGDVLACHGYRCGCAFTVTTEQITPGPFPTNYPR